MVVGSPVAGRGRAEWEGLIGCFVNTLVLRMDVSGGVSFGGLLERVRRVVVEAFAHQDVPFERLVEELRPERDLSRNPLFQIMFAVEDDDTATVRLPGIEASSISVGSGTSKFDLSVTMSDRPDGLSGSAVFSTDLFERDTVQRLMDGYVRLLEAVASAPDEPISNLELLPQDERRRVLREWNDTDVRFTVASCPHDLIAEQVRRSPEAVAVVDPHGDLTYAELDRRSNQVARWLRNHGVGPEIAVAVSVERSAGLAVAMLGVLKAGGVHVPVPVGHPLHRREFMIASSGARVLVTGTGERDGTGGAGLPVLALDREWEAVGELSAERLDSLNHPDNLAALYYTSGSTGQPKGVALTHRGVVNYLGHLATAYGLTGDDVVLQLAAPGFDASIRDILGPLTVGARTVLVPHNVAEDPYAVLSAIAGYGVTSLLSMVPSMLSALSTAARSADADTGTLRLGLVSGEPLTPAHVSQARRLGGGLRLVNLYGPTECTMTSTFHHVARSDAEASRIPVGRPIANTRCYVLGPELEPLPAGAVGELHIASPGLARGYAGDPSRTAERFVPDPYGVPGSRMFRTGDLVRWLPDGDLIFHGRKDDQVKIRGVRVEPGEVEAALLRHPAVAAAAVTAHGEGAERELVGYLVPGGSSIDVAAVRDDLALSLPSQMLPSTMVVMESLPLTSTGKVDRGALRPPERRHEPGLPPRDLLELNMVRIWERVLGREPVGVTDDFFALGGHSLKAVELVDAIHRDLGVLLPLNTLFTRPTVERLCGLMADEGDLSAVGRRLVVPLNESMPGRPALFLVHPQSGDVCSYLHLARELRGRVNAYGIEAVGYNTPDTPLGDIGEMAARYLAEIRSLAPHGPYLLAGWSFGGNVAFEMAALLEEAGEEVGFLGIIDARAFGVDEIDDWYRAENAIARYGIVAGISGQEIRDRDEREVLEVLLRDAHARGHLPRRATTETMRRMVAVFTANGEAADRYRRDGRIAADIHLFKASDLHPTLTNPRVDPLSWGERTTGDLHLVGLPGNHHDLVLPPYAKTLAERIASALEVASPEDRPPMTAPR
ncbi:non-ribosomal peptide synthetase [Streptosporangium sp. NPDC001682]